MNLAAEQKMPIIVPTTLAASGRFGGFKPESEIIIREAKVVRNPNLEEMRKAWMAHPYDFQHDYSDSYEKILSVIKNLEYSANDVEIFSVMLAEFQDDAFFRVEAGNFLSALINNCKEDDFVIHTSHLARTIHYLGQLNMKNLYVDGDVGDEHGHKMLGGSIIVKGDAGGSVGYDLHGGRIIVEGEAGDAVGCEMRGGSITVKGNAGERVGVGMHGGEIHIDGEYRSIGDDRYFGKIFHKEQLIWRGPKWGGSE
jgi:hypothetical protein